MLEWKRIRRHRHVILEGKPLCGVFGGYDEHPALPCEVCLGMIQNTLADAILEEVIWDENEVKESK